MGTRCVTTAVCVVIATVSYACPALSAHFSGPPNDAHSGVILVDEFQIDSLKKFEVQGDISWSRGALALGAESSLGRQLGLGSPLHIDLSFEHSTAEASVLRSTRVYLWPSYGNTVALFVEHREMPPDSPHGAELRFGRIDRTSQGETESRVIRTIPVKAFQPSANWKIRYRFGLIELEQGGQRVGATYCPDESIGSLNYIGLAQKGAPARLQRLSIKAAPEIIFDADQKAAASESSTMTQRVVSHNQRGEFLQALDASSEAIRLAQRAIGTRHLFYINTLFMQATTLSLAGDPQARQRIEEVLTLATDSLGPGHPRIAQFLVSRAEMQLAAGDRDTALAGYIEALQIAREAEGDQSPAVVGMLEHVGARLILARQPAEGLQYLEEARKIHENLGDKSSDLNKLLTSEAEALIQLGRHNEAFERLSTLRTHFQSSPPDDALDVVELWRRIAAVEMLRNRPQAAREALGVALAELDRQTAGGLARRLQTPRLLGDAYLMLSFAFGEAQQFTEALRTSEAARNAYSRIYGEHFIGIAGCYSSMAGCYLPQGQYADARRCLQAALDLQIEQTKTLIGGLSESEALLYAAEALETRNALLYTLGKTAASSADAYRPVWDCKALVTMAQGSRRRLLSARSINSEAAALTSKLDTIRRQISAVVLGRSLPPEPAGRDAWLREYTGKKESLERQLALLCSSPAGTDSSSAAPTDLIAKLPVGLALVDFIESDEKYRTQIGYEAFILRRDAKNVPHIEWVRLKLANEIDQAVRDWRRAIVEQIPPGADGPEQKLRKLVWEPIEAHLGDCQKIILLPDGALTGVPWGALPGSAPNSHLIESYEFITANHAQQVLELLNRPSSNQAGLLAIGSVDYEARANADSTVEQPTESGTNRPQSAPAISDAIMWTSPRWNFLPGTATEVDSIVTTWSVHHAATDAMQLKGKSASEQSILATIPKARWIHLATHGFFAPPEVQSLLNFPSRGLRRLPTHDGPADAMLPGRNPLALSGIVLAGANTPPLRVGSDIIDDGLLTAEEIVGLDLSDAELVVLSACETGLGEVAGGEGVFGLERSLMLGGARSVVASLWQVPDLATSALMNRFYHNLWNEKMPKGAALREAQLWLLREGASQPQITRGLKPLTALNSPPNGHPRLSPYYWAAFGLAGDWR